MRVPSGIGSPRRSVWSTVPSRVTVTPLADETGFPSSNSCCTLCPRGSCAAAGRTTAAAKTAMATARATTWRAFIDA